MGHFAPSWKFLILIVIGLTVPTSASPAILTRSSTCLNPFYNEHVQFIQVHGPYLLPYSLDVDPTADIIRTKLSTLDAAKICTSLDLEPIIIENLDQFKQFSELLLLSIGSGEARSSFSVNLDGIKKNGVLRSIQDSRRILPFHAFDMRFQPVEKETPGDKGKNCLNLVCSKKVGDCSFQLVNCIQSQVIPVCQYPKGSACYQDNMVGSRSMEGIDKLVEVGSTATRSFYWSIKQKNWKEALSFCSLNGMQLLTLYPDDDQDMVILFHLLEKFRTRLEVREWMSYSWLNSSDKVSNTCALLVSHDDVRKVECTLKAFFVCSIDTSNFRATVEVTQVDEQHPTFISSKWRRKIILRPQIILKPRLILNTTRMDLTGQLPEIEVRPIIKIEEASIIKTNNPVPVSPPLLQQNVQNHPHPPPKDSFDFSSGEVVSTVNNNKKNKSSAIPPPEASTSKPSLPLPLISQINFRIGAVPGEERLPKKSLKEISSSCPEPRYTDKNKSRSRLIRLGQDGPYLFPKTIQFMTSTKAHALCTKLGLESVLIESPTQYNYLMEQLPQYNQFNELNEFALHLDGVTDDTPGKLGEFVTSQSGDDLPSQTWKLTDDGEYFATRATCLVLFCSNSTENDDRNVTDRDCFYKATDCDKDRKVIPLCQYKKDSECYQSTRLISTDIRLAQDINRSPLSPVGQSEHRVYYGSRKQENWTDAMYICKSQGLELLSFPKHDMHESHEIWRALDYYKSISGLPHWMGISWTSGRFSEGFGSDEYFTFEKTAEPGQFQQERWEYQDNEGLWIWHDTLVKKKEVEICMVALSGEMIRPILCEMKNYFICWEKREAVDDEFPLSQAGITERLSSEETVDNNDSGMSQDVYFFHTETTSEPPEAEAETEIVEDPKIFYIEETTVNDNDASTTTTTSSSTVTSFTSTPIPTDNPMTTVQDEGITVNTVAPEGIMVNTVFPEDNTVTTVAPEGITVNTVAPEGIRVKVVSPEGKTVAFEGNTVKVVAPEGKTVKAVAHEGILVKTVAHEGNTVKVVAREGITVKSVVPEGGDFSNEEESAESESAESIDKRAPEPKSSTDETATGSSNLPDFGIDSKEGHPKQLEKQFGVDKSNNRSTIPQPSTKSSIDVKVTESSSLLDFGKDSKEGNQNHEEIKQSDDDKSNASVMLQPNTKLSMDEKVTESSRLLDFGEDSKEGHLKYEGENQSGDRSNTSATPPPNTKSSMDEKETEASNVTTFGIDSKEGHPKPQEVKQSGDDMSNASATLQSNTKLSMNEKVTESSSLIDFGEVSKEDHSKYEEENQSGDRSNTSTTPPPNTKSTEASNVTTFGIDSKEEYPKPQEVKQSGNETSNASTTLQSNTKLSMDEKVTESSSLTPYVGEDLKEDHPKYEEENQSGDDKSNTSATPQPNTKLSMNEKATEASNVPNFGIDSKEGHPKQLDVKESGDEKSNTSATLQPNTKLSMDEEVTESSILLRYGGKDLKESHPKYEEENQPGDDKSNASATLQPNTKLSMDEKATKASNVPNFEIDSKEGHPKQLEVRESGDEKSNSTTPQPNTKPSTNEKATELSKLPYFRKDSKHKEVKQSANAKSNARATPQRKRKLRPNAKAKKFSNVPKFRIHSKQSRPKQLEVKQTGNDKSNTKPSTDEKAAESSSLLSYVGKNSKEGHQKHEEVNQEKQSGDYNSNASGTPPPNADSLFQSEFKNSDNASLLQSEFHPSFQNSDDVSNINQKTAEMANDNKTTTTTSLKTPVKSDFGKVPLEVTQNNEQGPNSQNKQFASRLSSTLTNVQQIPVQQHLKSDFEKVPVEIFQHNEQGPNSQNKEFASTVSFTSTTVQPIVAEQHLKSDFGKIPVEISRNNDQEPKSQNEQFASTSTTVRQIQPEQHLKSDFGNDSIEKLL